MKEFLLMKINEEKVATLVAEEINKSDILKVIKSDKDFEKRVKQIANDVIVDLFRVLWQHNNIYKNLAR
jgi:hypothetical protein